MENKTRREFIGIPIDSSQLQGFGEMLKKMHIFADKRKYDIKWVPIDNLHITLQFLGNIQQAEHISVEKKMNEILKNTERFQIDLRNIDAFGSLEKGRLVWMGVRESQNLMGIQSEIQTACHELLPENFKDQMEFKPHVSLARLRNQKHLRSFLEPFMRKKFGQIEVDKICLYESVLQNRFPVYKPLKTWELK